MFDVGQKVICVRREPWVCWNVPGESFGPRYLSECTVAEVWPRGSKVLGGKVSDEDGLRLYGWLEALYPAAYFRPKEPNIEALRSLITKIPAKQPEKV
jgi:hypothetical protein